MRPWSRPAVYRLCPEAVLTAGLNGIGRVGADFFDVLPAREKTRRSLAGRYPESRWSQLGLENGTTALLGPGPAGPVATVRFEMFREGLEVAQARVFIERALTDEEKRARLGADLVRRSVRLLDERVRAILRIARPHRPWYRRDVYWWTFASSGWQECDGRLFDLAGEVARALASTSRPQGEKAR